MDTSPLMGDIVGTTIPSPLMGEGRVRVSCLSPIRHNPPSQQESLRYLLLLDPCYLLSQESFMNITVLTTKDENAIFEITDMQDAVRGELVEP